MELEEQEEAPSKFKIIPVDLCPVVTVGPVLKEMKTMNMSQFIVL